MARSKDSLLDKDQWKLEAESVIRDVRDHVKEIFISLIDGCDNCIYLNVMTVENKCFCIELSCEGFKVVGKAFDTKCTGQETTFETPYALLDFISPNYKHGFANSVIKKLNDLKSREPE